MCVFHVMAVMNSLFKCEQLWSLCHKKIREIFPIGTLHQPSLTSPGIPEVMGPDIVLLRPSAMWWEGTRSWVKWETCLLPVGLCRGSSGQAAKQPIAWVSILVAQSLVSSATAAVALAVCLASAETESKPLCVWKDYTTVFQIIARQGLKLWKAW